MEIHRNTAGDPFVSPRCQLSGAYQKSDPHVFDESGRIKQGFLNYEILFLKSNISIQQKIILIFSFYLLRCFSLI